MKFGSDPYNAAMNAPDSAERGPDLASFLPFDPAKLGDHQKALPAIANGQPAIRGMRLTVRRVIEGFE